MTDVRVPPHSIEAEQAVIGAVLVDVAAFDRVSGIVREDDFYRHDHRVIWGAIVSMRLADEACDVLTLSEKLKSSGTLDEVGGFVYLGQMAASVPSVSLAVDYANVIKDKSLLRQVIAVATEMVTSALDGDKKSNELIGEYERKVFELADRSLSNRQPLQRLRPALKDLIQHMDALNENPPENGVLGSSTGLADIDYYTSGLCDGDLTIVAARPAMGKTAFSMGMAHAVAQTAKPVLVFSMEMPTQQLVMRLLSAQASVPLKRVREAWNLTESDFSNIGNALEQPFQDSPLWFDDTAGLTIGELRSRARRWAREVREDYPGGLGMILVDYIQLAEFDGAGNANRNDQVSAFTRGLKALAKELSVPVVALSQLSRKCEERGNKRPMLSDLRDSGAIEQDADVIIFLYRDEYYNEDSPDAGIAEAIIAKHRNGGTGTAKLVFQGEFTRFRDLDRQHVDVAAGGVW